MLKIEIDASVVQEALKIVNTIAPPLTGNVIISCEAGLNIISIGEVNRCQLSNLPCRRKGEATFALPVETLVAAVKSRDTLTMVFENDVLNISCGTYSMTLSTVDVIREEAASADGLQGTKVTAEQAAWIRDALESVFIKTDGFLNQTNQHVALKLSEDGAFLCCYDGSRLAYAINPDITGSLDMTLPYNTLWAVASTFGMTNFMMAEKDGVLYVWNKVGSATMAMMAPKFTVPVELLLGRIEASREKPQAMWRADAAEIKAFMANARAITRTDTKNNISFRVSQKQTKLIVKTPYGQCNVEVASKANTDATFEIDMQYFEEFMARGYETVLIHNTYLAAHEDNMGAIVALNQSGAANDH